MVRKWHLGIYKTLSTSTNCSVPTPIKGHHQLTFDTHQATVPPKTISIFLLCVLVCACVVFGTKNESVCEHASCSVLRNNFRDGVVTTFQPLLHHVTIDKQQCQVAICAK
ncbi:unnamed protein product [Meganyctiphanes norvegica]|uniref:Uncharacterized protein n=1 Tax=Meganyctiphanes norvegica TaxID=48144 RepID=A0AAV2RMH2_MEGNR